MRGNNCNTPAGRQLPPKPRPGRCHDAHGPAAEVVASANLCGIGGGCRNANIYAVAAPPSQETSLRLRPPCGCPENCYLLRWYGHQQPDPYLMICGPLARSCMPRGEGPVEVGKCMVEGARAGGPPQGSGSAAAAAATVPAAAAAAALDAPTLNHR